MTFTRKVENNRIFLVTMMPDIKLLNMDCMKYMATLEDNAFDLAIVDPPYFKGPDREGYFGTGVSSMGIERARRYHSASEWDIPNSEYFGELFRVSKNQIIWGANHFSAALGRDSSCWIVWDKDNGNSSFADAELAFTSFNSSVRIFKYLWMGMHQGSIGNPRNNEKRIHPTQKPIALYRWLLEKYSKRGQLILDTHLGSGSSAIAAHYFGCDFVGCELDEVYYNAAVKRFDKETRQQDIFGGKL